jgi:4-hydroxythreonine-4-phosphate dehydrogenase
VSRKPAIALFAGDPAGVGPELVARLLADGEAAAHAHIRLIASRDALEEGMRDTGARFDYEPMLVAWPGTDARGFERGVACAKNGRFMLDGLRVALDLCRTGEAGAICFAPLNKAALRAGGMDHPDELHWFAETLAFDGTCVELNVLENLWTTRVTSHVALSEVSALITAEKVAQMTQLITESLRRSGVARPRIVVCGLNPHNGDGGAYGREEIDVIGPGVELARSRGFPADGPFPADTVFVRATRRGAPTGTGSTHGGYDGVVTMYHDQGQIAMKLMGFDRGVTVQGGLPMPITTPAHGTAYDIAGQGVASGGAMKNAFDLACRMAVSAR